MPILKGLGRKRSQRGNGRYSQDTRTSAVNDFQTARRKRHNTTSAQAGPSVRRSKPRFEPEHGVPRCHLHRATKKTETIGGAWENCECEDGTACIMPMQAMHLRTWRWCGSIIHCTRKNREIRHRHERKPADKEDPLISTCWVCIESQAWQGPWTIAAC